MIEAALAEIAAVGPARMSMREIARRAGVSHAAPAHHFGDKKGIFTAIAVEGFRRMRHHTDPHTHGGNALLYGGLAYVGFAATHPAHFEVMFRPDLYDGDDPDLQDARMQAFEVLFRAVREGLGDGETDDDVTGTAVAAWSIVHGFAALWLSGNLPAEMTGDIDGLASAVTQGIVAVGRIAEVQAALGLPSMEIFGIPAVTSRTADWSIEP